MGVLRLAPGLMTNIGDLLVLPNQYLHLWSRTMPRGCGI
jgi:hypothetical protein